MLNEMILNHYDLLTIVGVIALIYGEIQLLQNDY